METSCNFSPNPPPSAKRNSCDKRKKKHWPWPTKARCLSSAVASGCFPFQDTTTTITTTSTKTTTITTLHHQQPEEEELLMAPVETTRLKRFNR
jgi:hypothetical protein